MKLLRTRLTWCAMLLVFGWCATTVLAQRQTGTVRGTVLDGMSGDVIRGARVEIVGANAAVKTDLDGKFSIQSMPGTYQLRVTLDNYYPNQLDSFELKAGVDQVVDVVLVKQVTLTQDVTVTTESVQASTEAAMILERRSSMAVSDGISSQEISSNGDSDAAAVMTRVVGVSVLDDKYVYVRGLGERFSTTQLNGSLLPSTEADKKVVPLDLFPANLVDNIKLEKTFTPDQPGEFSGGLVRINTIEFPSSPTLKVSFSQGFNTNTTFKDFLTYPGGRYDWIGFDDGRRRLPAAIPPQRVVRTSQFSDLGFTPEQIETFGESFENVWNPRPKQAKPDQSVSFTAGNTFGKLGVVYAMSYGSKFRNQETLQNYYRVSQGEPVAIHEYTIDSSSNSVRHGNSLNFAFKANENHKLLFKNFFSKDTSDEVRTAAGFNGDFGSEIRNQRLRFIEESLYAGQVAGEHFLPGINALAQWRVAYSRADRDEPDIRETLYILNEATGAYRLRDQSQSGFRHFIESSESIWEPAFDFTKFFSAGRFSGSVKAGGVWTSRDRFFDSRRFRFTFRNTTGLDLSQDPETLFTPEHIGPNFELREDTRNTDHYLADQKIRAGYAMADLVLGSRWRAVAGLRVENSVQNLNSFDLFAVDPTIIQTRLDDTDYLPSFSVIYALTPRMNLRGAYTQTLSRPNFRELAPFDFTDVTGGHTVVGNQELQRTKINNFDLRWEFFQTATDLISTSLFYKDFDNPIEQILRPTSQLQLSFVNVERAQNWGIETEARKDLSAFTPALQYFSASANYTYVRSEVEIGERLLSVVTSTSRPLAGQSRHVFNGGFEYANPRWGHNSRLLYNMVGRRISDVGALGLPDIYQEGQHVLDFVLQQKLGGETSPLELKFSAGNLLDDEKRYTQGGKPYRVYREGRSYSIGLSYQFF